MSEMSFEHLHVANLEEKIAKVKAHIEFIDKRIEDYEALAQAYTNEGDVQKADHAKDGLLRLEQSKAKLQKLLNGLYDDKMDLDRVDDIIAEYMLKGKIEDYKA